MSTQAPPLPILDQVLDKLQAGVILLDDQLNVCFWNDWMAQHSGIPFQQISGQTLFDALNLKPESYLISRARQTVEMGLSSILSNTIHRHPLPLFSLERKHEYIEQKLILSRLSAEGKHYCLIHVYDVSEILRRENSLKRQARKLQRTVRELSQAEEQILSIFELSPEGIMILDSHGQLQKLNAAAERMFEIYDYPDLYNFLQLIEEMDSNKLFEDQFFAGTKDHVADNLYLTGVSLSGRSFPVKISVLKTRQGGNSSFSVICRDISESKATEKRLTQLAHFDSLTGLANRSTFNDRLDYTLKKAQRYDLEVALIFIDLDNLKPVNDRFGHRGGDLLLREVAQRLQLSLRDTDLVARIGGDEFTIIISESTEHSLPDMHRITQRLLEQIRQPMLINSEEVIPSASIGVAVSSSLDADEMVRHADIAMYQAKQKGKGGCVFYEEGMGPATQR
ncbi:diguanylate cyclase domain-containing protein [Neptuniibacter halophilus]|uniref:diguanylate cyclase domain-containing protein n=1 Tax=Neptuniibacter halophilus TaxID=651666 RepID=UPI00257489CB|nr:diguanylate cyclase [Neptuniibacter halophilus]